MKILSISGTRPDFIRLMPTVKKLDKYFDHKFVWAAQNFDKCLADKFFKEFNRIPDLRFPNEEGSIGNEYFGRIFLWLETVYKGENPDCILVLGDTNASFSAAFIAKKMGIPVFHWEAGNRCFDMVRVPEEVNRRMIDSISDWHLCYTQRSREHLLLEGKRPDRIIVVGNPIIEALREAEGKMPKFKQEDYILATIHRKENVNNADRLISILNQLNYLGKPVKLSNHPTLASNLKRFNKSKLWANIEFFEPNNFTEFAKMEREAYCVVTDSGTVPEECHYFETPCVLIRYSTERPELLEANSMVMCENPKDLKRAITIAVNEISGKVITEYHQHVSGNVVKILMRCKSGTT